MPQMPNIPNLRLQERFPKLPNLPNLPAMPEMPSLVDQLPSMRLPEMQCLSSIMKMDVKGPMWMVMLSLRQLLIVVTALLVYTELFLLTMAWGTLTTLTMVFPVGTASPGKSFRRFYAYLASVTSPRLALHATPVIGRFVPLHKPQRLADLSVMFRLLAFVLI